jgi:hypothetical protein
MISIDANIILPDKILLNRSEFEMLIKKIRESEEVVINEISSAISIDDIMKLEERSGSFDYLSDEKEDIYTVNDLKVRYK